MLNLQFGLGSGIAGLICRKILNGSLVVVLQFPFGGIGLDGIVSDMANINPTHLKTSFFCMCL